MSNVKVFTPIVQLKVDNDKSANEVCQKIFGALATEEDSISLFCIIHRKDGETTFHSSDTDMAKVLFNLEQFKHDLLSGRYNVEPGTILI